MKHLLQSIKSAITIHQSSHANTKSTLKVHRFVMLITLLIIGMGQMWADTFVNIPEVTTKNSVFNATNGDYTINGYATATTSTTTLSADNHTFAYALKFTSTSNKGSGLAEKSHVRFTLKVGEAVRVYFYHTEKSATAIPTAISDYSQSSSSTAIKASSVNPKTITYIDYSCTTAGTYAFSSTSNSIYVVGVRFSSTSTDPTLSVSGGDLSSNALAFGSQETSTETSKTFNLSGSNLTADASLSITGDNAGMFTVTPTSVTPSNSSIASTEITVKYTPTVTGSHSATLTISSTGATSKTISLTGTGTEPTTPLTTFAWSKSSDEITVGDTYISPTFSAATSEGSVTVSDVASFESSNTDLATVATDGTVSLVSGATGTATITATAKSGYSAIAQTYTVTVNATKYAVTYAAGDGSGTMEGTSYEAGATVTLPTSTFTAPTGKVFSKWLCSVDSKEYAAGAEYTMTAAATTFTAQWGDAPTYTGSLIKAVYATNTSATVTGCMTGATADVNVSSGKLGSNGHYFGVKAAYGETFMAGDIVKIHLTSGGSGSSWWVFNSSTASEENLIYSSTTGGKNTDLQFTLSADQSSIYVVRSSDYSWNPTFGYLEVIRPVYHNITYTETKEADMSAYPTQYMEGEGVTSFTALANVDGWAFAGWDPASIGTDATTDQTITAQWKKIYNVKKGTVSGNGDFALTTTSAAEGTEVTLEMTISPADGYDVSTISVKDASDNDIVVSDNKFTMPASDVTVNVTFVPISDKKSGGFYRVTAGSIASLKACLAAAEADDDCHYVYIPNGTYDFGTLPTGSTALITISQNNMVIIGESMDGVILKGYVENEGSARGLVWNKGTNNYFQNLTLQCTATYNSSAKAERSEALYDTGSNTICKNVYLKGTQDTYYSNSAGAKYFEGGKIEGTVDFICGDGTLFFEGVDLNCVTSENHTKTGTMIAPKNGTYVFNNCTVEKNIDPCYLGRAWDGTSTAIFAKCTIADGMKDKYDAINSGATLEISTPTDAVSYTTYFSDSWEPKRTIQRYNATYSSQPNITRLASRTYDKEYNYATFSNTSDAFFPKDGENGSVVRTITVDASGILTVTDVENADARIDNNIVSGYFVPANSGVLVKSTNSSVLYYTAPDLYKEADVFTDDNMLYPGTGSEISEPANCYYYKLAYNDYTAKTGLGFYWGAENGGAFTVKSGAAYLAVPTSKVGAKSGFAFDEDYATGISEVVNAETENAIAHNIAGQRVKANAKGILIVNGKKYYNK